MRRVTWSSTVLVLAACASERADVSAVASETTWPAAIVGEVVPATFDSVRALCGGAMAPCPFKSADLIVISADDAVLVGDARRGLHRYPEADGWRLVGRQGSGPGEFMVPIAAAFGVDGRLRVFDPILARITTLDASLRVVTTTLTAAVPGLEGAVIDATATYVLFTRPGTRGESPRRVIARLAADGGQSAVLDFPIADYESASAGREMQPVPPLFAPRVQWSVSGSVLYAASGADDRVVIVDGAGVRRSVITGVPAEPVTEAQRDARRAAVGTATSPAMRQMLAAARAQSDAVQIADHPRFTAVVPVREGGVLLRGSQVPGAVTTTWYTVREDGSAGAVFSMPAADRIVAVAWPWVLVAGENAAGGLELAWRRWSDS